MQGLPSASLVPDDAEPAGAPRPRDCQLGCSKLKLFLTGKGQAWPRTRPLRSRLETDLLRFIRSQTTDLSARLSAHWLRTVTAPKSASPKYPVPLRDAVPPSPPVAAPPSASSSMSSAAPSLPPPRDDEKKIFETMQSVGPEMVLRKLNGVLADRVKECGRLSPPAATTRNLLMMVCKQLEDFGLLSEIAREQVRFGGSDAPR